VAALVEYDGTGFSGWQSQSHAASIQDAVEAAVGFVAGHRLVCICAGRTDAGVHAAGQVIHFDTSSKRTPRAWVLGANTRLPPTVALQWAGEVTGGFHARHAATRRIYRYFILNRSARSALRLNRAAWIHRPLDAQAMHCAASMIFRRSGRLNASRPPPCGACTGFSWRAPGTPYGWRSRRTPTCTTWCATSWAL
jgi:tRNA pseudouridine38-40 synthase